MMEPERQSLPYKISYLATWDPSPIDCIFRVSPIFFKHLSLFLFSL